MTVKAMRRRMTSIRTSETISVIAKTFPKYDWATPVTLIPVLASSELF
jgi:hypothetical protein